MLEQSGEKWKVYLKTFWDNPSAPKFTPSMLIFLVLPVSYELLQFLRWVFSLLSTANQCWYFWSCLHHMKFCSFRDEFFCYFQTFYLKFCMEIFLQDSFHVWKGLNSIYKFSITARSKAQEPTKSFFNTYSNKI